MTRLASVRSNSRDGRLVVVSRDGRRYLPGPVPTMQVAFEQLDQLGRRLSAIVAALDAGEGELLDNATLMAPLPRAFQYCEGSTYLSHMERNRAARNAPLPPGHGTDPAVLQGHSDRFLGCREPLLLGDPEWGLDLEATVAVIVGDVPMGVSAADASACIRAVVLLNDMTLRNVIPGEYAKGTGFFQAKPQRAFAPLAVTTDGLGAAWDGRLLDAEVRTWANGELLGTLRTAVDTAFDFPDIIAYAARTRPLAAGTIVGSGTISNRDPSAGFGCLAEKRALEILGGQPPSRYLQGGDTVRIEAFAADGMSLFGAMETRIIDAAADRQSRL